MVPARAPRAHRWRPETEPQDLPLVRLTALPEVRLTARPPHRLDRPRRLLKSRGVQDPLLERDAELQALDSVLQARSGSSGQLVVIEGPPGIGKTRLLREARVRAESTGITVLGARGSELEREFGYGVVRQLFERAVARLGADERHETLGGAAAPAAEVIGAGFTERTDGDDPSFSIQHGLYWLTVNLTERGPLVLLVDDLHWSDKPSLRWLAYLVRRMDGLRLSVVVGARPAEPGSDETLLSHVVHDPSARVLRPGALSADGAQRLVRAALGEADPAFCAACHHESGGNPLLLSQLVAALAAESIVPDTEAIGRLRELGADAISRLVARRFALLPDSAGALAEAVALLGDGCELSHAAEVAGLDEQAAMTAADALAKRQILQRDRSPAFVHPMMRAAVYERMPPAERARGHGRAADVLAASDAPAESRAAQLIHAPPGGDPAVVEALTAAARQVLPRGAAESATAYLRRALAEPPPAEQRFALLLELAAAEMLVDGSAAVRHFEEAQQLAPTPQLRAEIAMPLSAGLFLMDRPAEAVAVIDAALARLGDADSGLRRDLEVGKLHVALTESAYYGVALELMERYAAGPAGEDLTGRSLATLLAFHAACSGDSRERVLDLVRYALEGGVLIGHANGGGAWASAALALLAADDQEMEWMIETSLAEAHRRGSGLGFAAAKVFGARLALQRGELAEAEAAAREGLEASAAWGIGFGPLYAGAFLSDALIEQGRLEEAGAALAAVRLPERLEFKAQTSWYLESRARLALRRGKLHDGVAMMLALGRDFASLGGHNPAFHPWRTEAALGLLGLGDRERARLLAGEEVDRARRWGAPCALGRALRVAGLADGGERGFELLREAVEILEASTARLEYAKALVELGAALRRANRRRDSREPLRRALELATLCQAKPLADRAETELLASGARSTRVALSGVEALTPSERRVAHLAADGANNRDIAQHLFVTIKTVELHLSSAYRKLDIGSRSQLQAALS